MMPEKEWKIKIRVRAPCEVLRYIVKDWWEGLDSPAPCGLPLLSRLLGSSSPWQPWFDRAVCEKHSLNSCRRRHHREPFSWAGREEWDSPNSLSTALDKASLEPLRHRRDPLIQNLFELGSSTAAQPRGCIKEAFTFPPVCLTGSFFQHSASMATVESFQVTKTT